MSDVRWRRAAAGLRLKLVALLPLAGAAAVAVHAAVRDEGKWSPGSFAAVLGLFVLGVFLDAAGRVLCLYGPERLARGGAVFWSVVAQAVTLPLFGVAAWVGFGPAADLPASAVVLGAAAVVQLASAVLFVNYMTGAAAVLGDPDVEQATREVRQWLVDWPWLTTLRFVGAVVLSVAAGTVLALFTGCLGVLIGYVLVLTAAGLAAVGLFGGGAIMYIRYAVALVELAREIDAQRAAGRLPSE